MKTFHSSLDHRSGLLKDEPGNRLASASDYQRVVSSIDNSSSSSGKRVPDTHVSEKPLRRKFSASYKLKILQEADGCTEPGQVGALLRREGLYSSMLTTWRRQRQQGILDGLSPQKRGRKVVERSPLLDEVTRLERENQLLRDRLHQAETIIEVQKKVSLLFATPVTSYRDES